MGALQWGGKQGGEEEEEKEEEKGWRRVLPTTAEEAPERHRKAETSELPPNPTVEAVQMETDGLETWGRTEPDFSSRGKAEGINKVK